MIKWKNKEARKAYQALVEHCISNPYEGYTERHHIVPRSMGGSDEADNLVRMSAQNHLLAHYWLWVGTAAREMGYAYFSMTNQNRGKMAETFKPTQAMLEAYESARIAHAENLSVRLTGKTLSPEHRAKIAAGRTGKTHSAESRAKMSAAQSGRSGKTPSAETRAKLSAATIGSLNGKSKKVLMRLGCGLTFSYGSGREAARCLGVVQSEISRHCTKGIKGFSYA